MITIENIRKLLAAADISKDPYTVATVAGGLLPAGATDEEAAKHFVRALTALRMTAAVARFSNAAPPSGPNGLIPWPSRARRFAANLKALAEKSPQGAALVEASAQELSKFELHQAADGNFQILDLEKPVTSGWLCGLADHKALANLWQFDRAETPVPPPIVFDGLGFGWALSRVLETTANSYLNYSCAVYVLESDPLALAMLLHLHDMQTAIASPRLRWIINTSNDAVLADFRRALEEHRNWTVPVRVVRNHMRNRQNIDMQPVAQEIQEGRQKRREVLVAQITAHYAGKGPQYWAKRFRDALSPADGKPAEPLRVMGMTSRYTTVLQHSMAELQTAAQQAGAIFDVASEPDDQSLENPFIEKIAALKPDLIVQISRMRYENAYMPRQVPFLTWDQDNLSCMRTPDATASLDGLTFVAGHGAVFGYGHLNWQRRNCIFCHPAGAMHRYNNAPVAPEKRAAHACDISYVSNASGTPEALQLQMRARWSREPSHGALFDELCREILTTSQTGTAWDGTALKNLAESRIAHPGQIFQRNLIHELMMDLHRFADRCFRHATLAWVSRWCDANGKTLRLYGNGWKEHPQLGKWAAGPAEAGEDLRAIYQASRINLQLIESGFIHSRALDGLAAGGFFLTRHVPADGDDAATLREIHELGKWAVENKIESPEQLTTSSDPIVRERWKKTLAHHPWESAHAIRVLKVWADMPHAAVAFPMLNEISFQDEAGFATLASKYLADEPLRKATTAQMRQLILDRFSYDSRWKQFVAGVLQGLEVG